jgi:hypothetical protein
VCVRSGRARVCEVVCSHGGVLLFFVVNGGGSFSCESGAVERGRCSFFGAGARPGHLSLTTTNEEASACACDCARAGGACDPHASAMAAGKKKRKQGCAPPQWGVHRPAVLLLWRTQKSSPQPAWCGSERRRFPCGRTSCSTKNRETPASAARALACARLRLATATPPPPPSTSFALNRNQKLLTALYKHPHNLRSRHHPNSIKSSRPNIPETENKRSRLSKEEKDTTGKRFSGRKMTHPGNEEKREKDTNGGGERTDK